MFVLVVTRRAATGELVRQTLGAEGWWVTAVADRETAVRSASDQAPQLVVIDGSMAEAGELVRFFATRHGGPGALLLAAVGDACPEAADADALLPSEPDADDLAEAARRLLKKPQAAPEEALPTPGQVLNAQDIFGDMLLEMEGGSPAEEPPSPSPPAAEEPPSPPPPPAEEPAESVETRPMLIPEPTLDALDEDVDFTFPALDEPLAPVAGRHPDAGADESAPVADGQEESLEEAMAPPLSDDAGLGAEAAAAPAPAGRDEVEPDAPAAAATTESVAVRLAAALRNEEKSAASEAAPASLPAPDPPPTADDAAAGPLETTPPRPASFRRHASFPGGTRFWLGIAAGLLVFVLASFLLDRYFASGSTDPAAVAAPAIEAVDLEALVDREMARREAELRESLLEEERRLQEQLDELGESGGG